MISFIVENNILGHNGHGRGARSAGVNRLGPKAVLPQKHLLRTCYVPGLVLPIKDAEDFYDWPDESFDDMDSGLAVQQYI